VNIEELARKAHEARRKALEAELGELLWPWDQIQPCFQQGMIAAVAAVLSEVGWRPISEAPEGAGYFAKHAYGSWIRNVHHAKELAVSLGFTHYLPEPAPPAREEEVHG
jgi:hypothetical protein